MKSKQQLIQSNQRTEICKICYKKIEQNSFHYFFTKHPSICHDCLLKLEPVLNEFEVDGVKCIHLYFYNQKIQGLLYQFKGCSDYELRTIFLEYYANYLKLKYKNYVVIPAPSFEKSNEERGFNHVVEIFKTLKLEMCCCIHKTEKVKQADLTTKERQHIKKVLTIDDIDLSQKKILIVDDVFTTGSTIRAMIDLVRQKHPKKIKVLVMSKTLDLEDR